MTPQVSIIMGSVSDLPIMEKAAQTLDEFHIPFEMHALSAHRTPSEVETFAREAASRGIKVIIAAAGMAAALPELSQQTPLCPLSAFPSTLHLMVWMHFGYRSDASRHSCCYRSRKRCNERRHFGSANISSGRHTNNRQINNLQKKPQN